MSRQIVEGAEDVKQALRELPDKIRRRMLRTALAAGARVIKAAAIEAAPKLEKSTPTRTAGLIKSRIAVRTSKRDRKAGDVGVFVNVRPAPGAERGAKKPTDPYYWQWLEFGRAAGMTRRRVAGGKRVAVRVGRIAPMRFLAGASGDMLTTALPKIEASLGRAVQKLNNRRPG
jgi:hypothetical protein